MVISCVSSLNYNIHILMNMNLVPLLSVQVPVWMIVSGCTLATLVRLGMTTEWVTKTNEFVEAAFARGQRKSWCPCMKCDNGREQARKTMCRHLQKHGFKRGYTRWTLHGEPERSREEVVRRRTDNNGTGLLTS